MKPSPSSQLPLRGRLDRRGRVTIPKPIRDLADMAPGKNVSLRARRNGVLVLEFDKLNSRTGGACRLKMAGKPRQC